MPFHDVNGREIAEGSKVEILGLAEGLLDGLSSKDADFLKGAVGMLGEVDEILDQDVSVMLQESASEYHFIRSPGNLLRVVD